MKNMPRMLAPAKTVLFVLLALIIVQGCGGGNATGGTGTTGGANPFVLQPTVYTVPTDASVKVVSVSPTSVVLSGNVPSKVVAGWTLINNAAGTTQFLRKVTGVSKSGTSTTFQTSPATLVDIFNDAHITNSQQIGAAILAQMKPAQPGITFKPLPVTRDIGYSNEMDFKSVQISDAGGLNSVGQLDGSVQYAFGFETALDVGVRGVFDLRPKINKFRVAPYLKLNGQLTLTASTKGSFTKHIDIGSPVSFPVASLGPVPINLTLQFGLELDGTFNANGVMQVTGSVDMSAGIDCTNDVWTTINTFDHSFTVTPPHLAATATLTLSAIDPTVGVGIPDIGSMYVKAEALRAGLTISYQSQPSGFNIATSGDFKFTAGGTIKLGPFTAFDGQLGNFDFGAFSLGKPTFISSPPPSGSTICYWYIAPSLNPREIFTADAKGLNPHNVLNQPNLDQAQPYLSRDASKIVYCSQGSIYTCGVDGSNNVKVMDAGAVPGVGAEYPCWSPDGSTIAFNSSINPSGGSGQLHYLYLLDATGSAPPKKVGNTQLDSFYPRYSPDGTKMVFDVLIGSSMIMDELDIASNTVTPLTSSGSYYHACYGSDDTQLFCIDATTGVLNVFYKGIGVTPILASASYDWPCISPDGTRVLVGTYGSPNKLVTCDVDGQNPLTLATDLGGDGTYPSWASATPPGPRKLKRK